MLLLPVAAAEPKSFPVAFDAHSTGSLTLGGEFTGQAALHGIAFDRHAGPASLDLTLTDAQVLILRQPQARSEFHPQGPVPAFGTDDPLAAGSTDDDFTFTGHARVEPGPNATVFVLPQTRDAAIRLPLRAPPASLEAVASGSRTPSWEWYEAFYDGRLVQPRLDGATANAQHDLNLTDNVLVLVHGPPLVLRDSDSERVITTGPRPGLNATSPVPGHGWASLHDEVYAVIVADAATVMATTPLAWDLHVAGLSGHVVGEATFTGVQRFDGEPALPISEAGLLQVTGWLDVAGSIQDHAATWHVTGEATHFGIDGATVKGERGIPLPTIVAFSGGLGLLGLLAWLLHRLGAFAAWAGYHKPQPLESPTRARLLVLVATHPGVTISQLAARLGIRRPSVLFHARRLAGAGLLTMQRRGRQVHFTAKEVPPNLAVEAGNAPVLAALHQPVRRALLQHLMDTGPMTVTALNLVLHGKLASKLTFNQTGYHLRALARAGLVTSRRADVDGRHVIYEATEQAPATAQSQAASQPEPARSHGHAPGARSVAWTGIDKALDQLATTGFLSRDDSGLYRINREERLWPAN